LVSAGESEYPNPADTTLRVNSDRPADPVHSQTRRHGYRETARCYTRTGFQANGMMPNRNTITARGLSDRPDLDFKYPLRE
jgi:hypothetical protein